MPSPFPGMDPFLEESAHWPTFQHHLLTTLYHMLLPNLVDRYRAKVGTRSYVVEQVLFTSIQRDEYHEEYIEIRQRADGRPTTVLSMVSPTSRTTTRGRQEYLAFREANRQAGASVVDIDLVLAGTPVVDYPRDGHPEHDYAATLARAGAPDKIEVYPTTLRKPLPRFKLALGRNERDLVVDLGIVFAKAYDQGRLGERIDYAAEPKVKLRDADRAWVAQFLGGSRKSDA